MLATPRAKPGGWGFLEKFESTEATQMDVNIELLDQAFDDLNEVNVEDYGAIGNGSDSTTAQDNALAALILAGKGWLVFPPGRFVRTSALSRPAGVHIRGVTGESILSINHATAKSTILTDGTAKQASVIYGMRFEAEQANTGTVFHVEAPSLATQYLIDCSTNDDASPLLNGALVACPISETIAFRTKLKSRRNAGSEISGLSFKAKHGKLTMAPGATDSMVFASTTVLEDVDLEHVSTAGGIAFVGMPSTSEVRIHNCRAVRSGTGKTYLLELNSAARGITSGNSLLDGGFYSYDFYKVTSHPLLLGSDLQLAPNREHSVAAGPFTGANGVRSELIPANDATAPTTALPKILFQGQRYTWSLANRSGGTWSGAPGVSSQSPDAFASEAGLTGLTNGQVLTREFYATYLDWASVYSWLQVGAAVKL